VTFEERCPCGGSLAVSYEARTISSSIVREEATRTQKQIDTFRRAHKECLKRLTEAGHDQP
jgi:hypothetical protein